MHENNSPVTKFQFIRVLNKCLEFLHLDSFQASSHSFRIGTATAAANMGLDKTKINRIGRWKSNAYASYIRPNLNFELQV